MAFKGEAKSCKMWKKMTWEFHCRSIGRGLVWEGAWSAKALVWEFIGFNQIWTNYGSWARYGQLSFLIWLNTGTRYCKDWWFQYLLLTLNGSRYEMYQINFWQFRYIYLDNFTQKISQWLDPPLEPNGCMVVSPIRNTVLPNLQYWC